MNVAIITARKGSKSIQRKNIRNVAGQPLVRYPINAGCNADRIDAVYISTNGEDIADVGREDNCKIIWRPKHLWGDEVNHGDVIKHAVEETDKREDGLKHVVVLLGNLTMIDDDLIDLALKVLEEKPEVDSTMTVWRAEDDHPQRALEIDENGFLHPHGDSDRNASTDRRSYVPAFFFDQGVWAFHKDTVQDREGPSPWWWMGENCQAILRTWTTGRDIHSLFDIAVHEWYERNRDMLREYEERMTYEEYHND